MIKDESDRRSKNKLDGKENLMSFDYLAPKDDINDPVTFNLIKQALDNDRVKNIALTGPYGGGKSSILRTFEKENKKNYNFLHISLADFSLEEIKDQKGRDIEKNNFQETLQRIEKSILQQILYRVSSDKVPNSRFKRIKVIDKKNKVSIAIFILLYFLSFTVLFKNTILKGNLGDELLKHQYIYIWAWNVFVLYSVYILKKGLEWSNNTNLKKINLKNVELEICQSNEDSILNKHLDEILYFFEVTNFKVVIIEDLDRLPNVEIFTKLREINTLINQYEKVNGKVTFIYAVKDEIFKNEKERTKFFEVIIPIISVINSSNSGEELAKKLKGFDVSRLFIDNIALFIDDMRLLTNISNEFKLYNKKLSNVAKDGNKLLGMIVYKNICPNDFAELLINKGAVYKVINDKENLIRENLMTIAEEINEYKNQISDLEKSIERLEEEVALELLNSVEELKRLYACTFLKLLPDRAIALNLDNNRIEFKNLSENFNFNLLQKANNRKYFYRNYNYIQEDYLEVSFEDIEEELKSKLTYKERLKRIELKKKKNELVDIKMKEINELKLKLESLEIKQSEINDKKISTLLKENKTGFLEKHIDKKLIKFLLRNGYIDENYNDYISYFYSGSLTIEDKRFLTSVKTGEVLEFDYKLKNIGKVIEKLYRSDYREKGILNYSLLEYMGDNFSKLKNRYKKIIKGISDDSQNSIDFILSYQDKFPEDGVFMRELCKEWDSIWEYVVEKSNLSDEKKRRYLQNIINYADIESILEINKKFSLKNSIEKWDEILYLNLDKEKLEEVIIKLNIKFEKLDIPEEKKELLDYIYTGKSYIITPKNIEYIIKNTGGNIEGLRVANYSTIKKSSYKKLLEYIHENLESYIKDVFLVLENNINESEETVIELINNGDISLNIKNKIIEKQRVRISSLEGILEEVWDGILKENKVIPSWSNIILSYKKGKEITEAAIEFINRQENFKELSKEVLVDNTDRGEEIEEMALELLKNNRITSEALESLVDSYSCQYNTFESKGVSKNRIEELITLGKISLTQENIDDFKESHFGVHLQIIKRYKGKFLSNPNNLILSIDDFIEILACKEFSSKEKVELINKLDNEIYTHEEADKLLLSIYEQLFKGGVKEIESSIINQLIKHKIIPLTQENLENLDSYKENKRLNLVKEWSEKYFINPNSFNLELEEILEILEDDEFTGESRTELVNLFKDKIFIKDPEDSIIQILCKILYEYDIQIKLNRKLINRLTKSEKINEASHRKAIYFSQECFLRVKPKLSLFIRLFEAFSDAEIKKVLNELGGDYIVIAEQIGHPTVKNSVSNGILCTKLKSIGYISSFKLKGDKIKIYNKKRGK